MSVWHTKGHFQSWKLGPGFVQLAEFVHGITHSQEIEQEYSIHISQLIDKDY
jgi:hypothetical protein